MIKVCTWLGIVFLFSLWVPACKFRLEWNAQQEEIRQRQAAAAQAVRRPPSVSRMAYLVLFVIRDPQPDEELLVALGRVEPLPLDSPYLVSLAPLADAGFREFLVQRFGPQLQVYSLSTDEIRKLVGDACDWYLTNNGRKRLKVRADTAAEESLNNFFSRCFFYA